MYRGRLVELEAVVAVAKRRSFRAAATDVGLSATALSQAVAELEGRIGVRLFNRTTRSVAPTAAGEQFVAQVAPALGTISEAIEAVNQHRASPTGVLKLTSSVGAAQQILTPVIFEYLRRFPDMSVDLVTEDRFVDIVKEGFDAGIRLAEHLPGDMIAVPLGPEQRLIVVGSPVYLKGRALPNTPRDLLGHACIRRRLRGGAVYRWEFERRGKKIDIDVKGRITLDEMDLMREAAIAGAGLAYLAEWHVGADVKAGQLVQVLADWTPPFPGLCLYYPTGRHMPLALRALIDIVRSMKVKSSSSSFGR